MCLLSSWIVSGNLFFEFIHCQKNPERIDSLLPPESQNCPSLSSCHAGRGRRGCKLGWLRWARSTTAGPPRPRLILFSPVAFSIQGPPCKKQPILKNRGCVTPVAFNSNPFNSIEVLSHPCLCKICVLLKSLSLSLNFSPRSELTSENLKWLENVFRRTVGDNGEIRLRDFKNIVHSKNVSRSGFVQRY